MYIVEINIRDYNYYLKVDGKKVSVEGLIQNATKFKTIREAKAEMFFCQRMIGWPMFIV